MKKIHFVRLAIVGLMMAGLLAFVSTNVQAVTGTISSTVSIECPVEIIANGGAVAFGYLAAPSSGFDHWTLSPAGGPLVQSGTGDGTDFNTADHSRGDFTIKGSELIYYSVAVRTDFPTTNLNLLEPLTLSLASPQDPSPANGDCLELIIYVGGTLEVFPGAPTGAQSATITITANY